jgi:hypothetical protein
LGAFELNSDYLEFIRTRHCAVRVRLSANAAARHYGCGPSVSPQAPLFAHHGVARAQRRGAIAGRARPPLSFLLPRGLFGVLICCICSMDGMLILFSLVFDRWTTTRTPPSELTDGSVVTGCTASVFPTCSGTCYTALATRRSPHVVTARTTSSCLGAARFIWTFRLIALTRP